VAGARARPARDDDEHLRALDEAARALLNRQIGAARSKTNGDAVGKPLLGGARS
jgi:hypothetical protein